MYRLGLCDSGEILGRNCYEVFFGRRERCEFCRKENLSYNSLLVCELFNRDMTRHYCNSARLIDWNGIPAYIEYISEDTESFFAYKKRNDLINNFPAAPEYARWKTASSGCLFSMKAIIKCWDGIWKIL